MTTIERGAVFIIASKGPYTSKPRPAAVIQSDDFSLESVLILPITREASAVNRIRVEISPSEENGLRELSYAMCDKISAIPASNLKTRIGTLDDETIGKIETALLKVLGLPQK